MNKCEKKFKLKEPQYSIDDNNSYIFDRSNNLTHEFINFIDKFNSNKSVIVYKPNHNNQQMN